MKNLSYFSVFLILCLVLGLFNVSAFQINEVKAQESNGSFGNTNVPEWLNISVVEDSDFVSVDNADGFVFKFRKGTAGYNIILENGSQIVEDERWRLEYEFKTDTWRMMGEPQYVTWEQPQPYHVVVKRFYTDSAGTTFNMTYSFYGGFRPKISFEGNIAQADTYRIQWRITGINKTYVTENTTTHHVKFWNEGEEAVCFDYSDVYESFGDITTVEIEAWAGNHKLNEVFNVGFLEIGLFELDPSFGHTGIETTEATIENNIEGTTDDAPEDGTCDSITAYMRCVTAAHDAVGILYEYDSGSNNWDVVTNGVTTETEIPADNTDQWYTLNFADPKPTITEGQEYVICVWGEAVAGDCYIHYGTETGYTKRREIETYTSPPPDDVVWDATMTNYAVSIYCNYTVEEGEALNFYGIVSPQFSINHVRSWSFSRYSQLNPTFTIQKRKTVAFTLLSGIIEAFSLGSSKTVSFDRYSLIAPSFTLNHQRSWTFNLYPSLNPTFAIDGVMDYWYGTILNLYGSIIQQFTINHQRGWSFQLFPSITPTFTIDGVMNYWTGAILNLFGEIGVTLNINFEKALTWNIYSLINPTFTINHKLVATWPSAPLTIGWPLALALLVVACLVTYTLVTNTRKEEE